ncbi:MAG TPA: TonB family protein [Steroidobacteraceae bacterium]|nr:TonB family protein [Steroidobacteraceae bacterium]
MKTRNDQDLARRLILRAARKAPAAVAQRLEEEWLADLASRQGSLARLRLAIGCSWATAVITRDFNVPQLATSGAGNGPKHWFADHRYDLPLLSRRTVTLLLIAGAHVLLIYVFASGFAQQFSLIIPQIMHGVVIEENRPQPPPPVLSTLPFKATVITDITDTFDPDRFDLTIARGDEPKHATDDPPGGSLPRGVPAVVRVLGGPGRNFPTTEDYYPTASRRISETGAANVQVCVDGRGYLTGAPTLSKSSGSQRIDDAALKLARAGSGHYRPTTEDGTPVTSCYGYRIRFELTD